MPPPCLPTSSLARHGWLLLAQYFTPPGAALLSDPLPMSPSSCFLVPDILFFILNRDLKFSAPPTRQLLFFLGHSFMTPCCPSLVHLLLYSLPFPARCVATPSRDHLPPVVTPSWTNAGQRGKPRLHFPSHLWGHKLAQWITMSIKKGKRNRTGNSHTRVYQPWTEQVLFVTLRFSIISVHGPSKCQDEVCFLWWVAAKKVWKWEV